MAVIFFATMIGLDKTCILLVYCDEHGARQGFTVHRSLIFHPVAYPPAHSPAPHPSSPAGHAHSLNLISMVFPGLLILGVAIFLLVQVYSAKAKIVSHCSSL